MPAKIFAAARTKRIVHCTRAHGERGKTAAKEMDGVAMMILSGGRTIQRARHGFGVSARSSSSDENPRGPSQGSPKSLPLTRAVSTRSVVVGATHVAPPSGKPNRRQNRDRDCETNYFHANRSIVNIRRTNGEKTRTNPFGNVFWENANGESRVRWNCLRTDVTNPYSVCTSAKTAIIPKTFIILTHSNRHILYVTYSKSTFEYVFYSQSITRQNRTVVIFFHWNTPV